MADDFDLTDFGESIDAFACIGLAQCISGVHWGTSSGEARSRACRALIARKSVLVLADWRRAFLIRSANASLPGEHVTTVLFWNLFQNCGS